MNSPPTILTQIVIELARFNVMYENAMRAQNHSKSALSSSHPNTTTLAWCYKQMPLVGFQGGECTMDSAALWHRGRRGSLVGLNRKHCCTGTPHGASECWGQPHMEVRPRVRIHTKSESPIAHLETKCTPSKKSPQPRSLRRSIIFYCETFSHGP